jgi:hypothetical protein
MSDTNNPLENYVVDKLKSIDKYARRTRGSGCGNEVGDIKNNYLYVECKIKGTKSNIIMERNVWKKHLKGLPLNTNKLPIYVTQNKENERFVILDADDFFNLFINYIKGE